MKTKPMITVLRREPVRSVSASSTESTHSEQGLKPSTSAISAVVTTSDCLPASTSPNTGSVMTSEAAFEPSSVGAAGDVGAGLGTAVAPSVVVAPSGESRGSMTPAPASGQPSATQAATASSTSRCNASFQPTQYWSPRKMVGTPEGSKPNFSAIATKGASFSGWYHNSKSRTVSLGFCSSRPASTGSAAAQLGQPSPQKK